MIVFHHVGIACKNIEPVRRQFLKHHEDAKLVSDVVFDPEQNAHLQLVQLSNGVHFEFISGPVVSRFVEHKIELYHTCFEADDFDEEIKRLLKTGAIPLGPPKPAILFGGRRVIFMKTTYGIVEYLESENVK
jgi:methylmalonyl-CoA/ethylmalonyl-CoA epimerase